MDIKVFDKITANLIENGIIASEDKEIYEYGLRYAATMALNIATTLFIGFIFNMVWQSVLFMGAYIPLRSYAGGVHARTPMRCYIVSVIMMVCVLIGIKYIPYNIILYLILTFISGAVIFIFAPIGDENKPLDEMEIKVFKRRARLILFVEIGLIILSMILNLIFVSDCLLISLVCSSLMLIISVFRKFIYQCNQHPQ